jgi:hypothetical protein
MAQTVAMIVTMCALGVIQGRGAKTLDPRVVAIGASESDFLVRHVSKVRQLTDASARSVFVPMAATPAQLETLRDTTSPTAFEAMSKTLQDSLAQQMKTSTNARDCVFAIVRVEERPGAQHVTLLKLDAVVEAAKMTLLNAQVRFEVLKELLPEPGKLQKALSWPDPRPISDVIMLDTNVTSAQYFENAYQVHVSPKSTEAESELLNVLVTNLTPAQLPAAVTEAASLSGRLDEVLDTLSKSYPALAEPTQAVAANVRPAGIVRVNKVAARTVVWRADGAEVRVPATLAGNVSVEQINDGWRISLTTRTQPRRD